MSHRTKTKALKIILESLFSAVSGMLAWHSGVQQTSYRLVNCALMLFSKFTYRVDELYKKFSRWLDNYSALIHNDMLKAPVRNFAKNRTKRETRI